MPKKSTVVAAVAGIAALGAGAYLLTRSSAVTTPNLASLLLSAQTTTSITTGGSVSFNLVSEDASGNNVGNVTASILENSSLVDTVVTGTNGTIGFSLTFNTAGSYSVTAQAAAITSQVVTVVVTSPTMTSVLTSATLTASATTINVGGNVAFSGQAFDQNGNGITGLPVNSVENGTMVATTGTNGAFSFELGFPSQGGFAETVIITQGTVQIVSNTVSITVNAVSTPVLQTLDLTATSSTAILTGGTVGFSLTALDNNGNPMPNLSVPVLLNGSLSQNFTTGIDGIAIFSITIPTVGDYSFQAVSGSVSSQTVAVSVTAPSTLATIALTSSATTVAVNGAIIFSGTTTNSSGTAIAVSGSYEENGSAIGTWASSSTGAFSNSITFGVAGSFTITAVSGSITSNSISITVEPAPLVLTAVAFTSPTTSTINVIEGASQTFSGRATDQNGNGLSGVTITPVENGASQTNTTATASNGTFSFNLSFLDTGSDTVYCTASSGGILLSTSTITVNVTATTSESISLTPTSYTVAEAGNVTFTATVSGRSTLSGDVLTIYEGAGGGGGIGTATTGSTGVATFSVSFPNSGTHTIYVEDATTTSNTATITVTAPLTNIITLTSTTTTSIPVGGIVSFDATVASATGGSVSGDSVTIFEDTGSGGGISTETTNASGIAAFTLTFPSAGTHTVYCTDSSGATSNSVTVTVTSAATTITLSASASSVSPGASVTFTASERMGSVGVSGSVLTLYEGSTRTGAGLGSLTTNSSGVATIRKSLTTAGTHTYTVVSAAGLASNTLTIVVT